MYASYNDAPDEKMRLFSRPKKMAAEWTLPRLPNYPLILVQNAEGARRDLLSSPPSKIGIAAPMIACIAGSHKTRLRSNVHPVQTLWDMTATIPV
jgi:hypothetical protein